MVTITPKVSNTLEVDADFDLSAVCAWDMISVNCIIPYGICACINGKLLVAHAADLLSFSASILSNECEKYHTR